LKERLTRHPDQKNSQRSSERLEEISDLIAHNLKLGRLENIFSPSDLHKGKGIPEEKLGAFI
jgi:hypothetical protein